MTSTVNRAVEGLFGVGLQSDLLSCAVVFLTQNEVHCSCCCFNYVSIITAVKGELNLPFMSV